jgi:hypothetical protein
MKRLTALLAMSLALPTLGFSQTCTTSAGAFGTPNAPVSGNICNFTHQLAQDCASSSFAGTTQQAIYSVQLSATSNAVISLSEGSGFTPYIALWPQGGGCSGSTSCGTYENIGGSAGATIALPSTSGLAAGVYDLLVGDIVDASITCAATPDATTAFTLSITSGSTPVKLQNFSVN